MVTGSLVGYYDTISKYKYLHSMYPTFPKNLKNQRMIVTYREELMIKLVSLIKTAWVVEFDKANFSFLLLRHSKSSGVLKKDPTFGFLTSGN